ncbi:MAG: hypothetical protein ACLQD8_06570 [Thermoplasmata archaeon]
MSSELVSGPDLGAGFLHQLSRDRDGTTTTFTYHAQAGGQDANGPPRGPLDVFGFVHPETPCMFGGPRCWHRRFLLPFDETSRVRPTYNRNRFVLETMIGQAHDGAPAAVEAGIAELLARVAGPLEREGIEWYVGGSAAAWLLGSGIRPRDLDVGTTRDGVDRVAELLREYLIEPIAPTDWPGAGIVRGARAFLGTFQDGIRVEWAVPIEPDDPAPLGEWTGRPKVARLETATFQGTGVRVTRPEYALVRAAEAGPSERVARLAPWILERGADRELLDTLLQRTRLSAPQRAELRRSVGLT